MRSQRLICYTLIIGLLFSCAGHQGPANDIAGKWLIVFPQHYLKNRHQREVYGRYQDSIIKLFGLKLISFSADGTFHETDSFANAGRWSCSKDGALNIQEGGRGFNPFHASFSSAGKEKMHLTQFINLEDEKIKLVWELKKITDDNEAVLFAANDNSWRQKPVKPEPDESIKKRLVAMLNYYSVYFTVIVNDATYFTPSRVLLPFDYYQHAIGMKAAMTPGFQQLFFDGAQAQTAYLFLEQALVSCRSHYPSAENFGKEYSAFFAVMAKALSK